MEDRNPSPPPEFEKHQELYRADSVGGTAISKQWVLSTLMEIISEVEKHTEKDDEVVEVSDDLQDSACKLWDICMDKDIAVYLLEFDIVEILYGVILKSKSPRLTEISVGILANMACNETACQELSKLNHLRSVVVALLASPDTPTLLETVRLLRICLSDNESSTEWLSSIVEDIDDFASSSQFILSSSTNGKLLSGLSEVMDLLCEKSSGVLAKCCDHEFVGSILESISQQCQDDPSSSLHSLCHSLHSLHVISETEKGKTIVELLRRSMASLLSSLFYQWMTAHPKVEYSDESRMTASEVSVSCCLSLASVILNESEQEVNNNAVKKNGEKTPEDESDPDENSEKEEKDDEDKTKESTDVDDEDREMIIKFARSVVTAKGVVSAVPVVSSINKEDGGTEFKTPLHFRNSPRVGTPISGLLKTGDSVSSVKTPIQSPEPCNHSPADDTPSRVSDGDFTPTTRSHDEAGKKEPPSAVLCDLANNVLNIVRQNGWLVTGESPRKLPTS